MPNKSKKKKGNKAKQAKKKVSKANNADDGLKLDEQDRLRIREAKSKTKAKYSIEQLLDEARHCINEFNYELAQKFCERALQLNHDHIGALETSSNLLMELGEYEKAKQCLGRAITLEKDRGYRKFLTLAQLSEGKEALHIYLAGLDIAKKAIENSSNSEESNVQTSSEESTTGGDSPTSEHVTSRDVASIYCSLAELYMTDLCFEEEAESQCKSFIDQAVATCPDDPETLQMLANFHLTKQELDEAAKWLEVSLSKWLPDTKQARESAAAQFECPLSYEARISTAEMAIELKMFDPAKDILDTLLDEDEDCIQVWYLLGLANHQHGEIYHGNARHYLKQAVKVSKQLSAEDVDSEVVRHCHQLLEELGEQDDQPDDDDDVEEGSRVEDCDQDSSDDDMMDTL